VPKVKTEKKKKKADGIILLEDLAPRKDVKGGAGTFVFGACADPFLKDEGENKPKKKSQTRKGGANHEEESSEEQKG
jgi:hypothetical protein